MANCWYTKSVLLFSVELGDGELSDEEEALHQAKIRTFYVVALMKQREVIRYQIYSLTKKLSKYPKTRIDKAEKCFIMVFCCHNHVPPSRGSSEQFCLAKHLLIPNPPHGPIGRSSPNSYAQQLQRRNTSKIVHHVLPNLLPFHYSLSRRRRRRSFVIEPSSRWSFRTRQRDAHHTRSATTRAIA